jgi:hypothetical protein
MYLVLKDFIAVLPEAARESLSGFYETFPLADSTRPS